jgi:hypothetical protein
MAVDLNSLNRIPDGQITQNFNIIVEFLQSSPAINAGLGAVGNPLIATAGGVGYEPDVFFAIGSLTLGGVGAGYRILGDFGNATAALRPMFQSSVVNGTTRVQAIPNGTATVGQFIASNSSDPANAVNAVMSASSASIFFGTTVTGVATPLSMLFAPGGINALIMSPTGDTSIQLGFARRIDQFNFASSPVTLTSHSQVCLIDCTGGNVAVTLPAATAANSLNAAQEIVFIRVDGTANTLTINRAGADTINGAASKTIPNTNPARMTFQSDGVSKWWAV